MKEVMEEKDVRYFIQSKLKIEAGIVGESLVIKLLLEPENWGNAEVIDETRIHLSNLQWSK